MAASSVYYAPIRSAGVDRALIEQGRSRGRAEAWRPWIAAGRRPALTWPRPFANFAQRAVQRLREWAAAEVATATVKREIIAHPALSAPAWSVGLAGFVEVREERERSDRIVVRLERIVEPRFSEKLERVRVSVRKGTAPPIGSFIEFRARLSPPLEPLRPGGYNFARDMYFQRIGASGFVLGPVRTIEAPHAAGLRLRYASLIDGMREAIDKRIRAVLPDDKGAIASALITG